MFDFFALSYPSNIINPLSPYVLKATFSIALAPQLSRFRSTSLRLEAGKLFSKKISFKNKDTALQYF
jgi:hypothetical protein